MDIDLRKISPREKLAKTRIQPEPPKIIKYDLVDQKIVKDVVFSSRRLTEIRQPRQELQIREILEQQTGRVTRKGVPLRTLQDMAHIFQSENLQKALETKDGFYEGDDAY